MKVPLSWLNEYFETSLSPDEVREALTLAGLEVESIDLKAPCFNGVVIAQVQKVDRHPHADRLVVAEVFDGKECFQVVCGAPNCRIGIKTAFAKIGATLLGKDGKTFKIKKGKLRDVESYGMLCGADELQLGSDTSGILEFPLDAMIGADVAALETDHILDISLTPNLGHCLSIRGIARELSAFLNLPLKEKKIQLKEEGSKEEIHQLLKVQLIDKRQALRYACRLVKGVQVRPSPDWLRKKIESCGLRSVNNVVDIGNFVMLKMGQPLHLFDADKIEDNTLIITSQTAFSQIQTLDGTLRWIPDEALLITDPKKPLAFAGVIGGQSSAVETTTSNILIESAVFSPQAIRKTSRLIGLKTDSSQRFERGIDPNGVLKALDEAVFLLQELADGQVVKGMIDEKVHAFTKKKIICRTSYVNQLLGTQLSLSEMATLLKRLDIDILEEGSHHLLVEVPTYRNDIEKEVDLVEEIARLYGYTNLPKTTCLHTTSSLSHTPLYLLEKQIRTLLMRQGLQEMITCDLISPSQAELFCESTLKKDALICVLQPKSIDQSVLRASLLPGLLQVVKYNCDRGFPHIAGCEIGKIHFKETENYFEPSMVGIILSGCFPHHWDKKSAPFDFFDLKGMIENLFKGLHIGSFDFEISHLHTFHPGRQARIKIGETIVGVLGEIHPHHLLKLAISQKTYYAELNLNELLCLLPKKNRVQKPPQFPGSERDWTVTLEEKEPVGHILKVAKDVSSSLLEKVILLDLYKSDQIGKDKKNATFRFFYRDLKQTMAYETVEREHARVIEAIEQKRGNS